MEKLPSRSHLKPVITTLKRRKTTPTGEEDYATLKHSLINQLRMCREGREKENIREALNKENL